MRARKQKKVDKALDMTFPASDPPASVHATGNEPPSRPPTRKAARVDPEDVEAAAAPLEERNARQRHRGLAREGLRHTDQVRSSEAQQGLGREGRRSERRRGSS
jgi:hypothetical protein